MINPISSPGDPIFYLHHTWLDKVWWGWQALDLPARLTDISGRNVQDTVPAFPGNSTSSPTAGQPWRISRRDGDPGNTTTLNHVLHMYGMTPNVTIADVMDIGGGYLCYEYV